MFRRLNAAICAPFMLLLLTFGSPLVSASDPPPSHQTILPLIAHRGEQAPLIAAFYYDGFAGGDADESFQIHNPSAFPIDLAGWQVRSDSRTAVFPPIVLPTEGSVWCAREAVAFRRTFGALPACEWGSNTSDEVPNLTGGALQLSNTGGAISLIRPDGRVSDLVVYKAGDIPDAGWLGEAIKPYTPTSALHEQGQVLYRKRDEMSGLALTDTNRATDWASDRGDPLLGRRVRYGGWPFERFFWPAKAEEVATLQVAIAPDGSYEALSQWLRAARASIVFEGFTFENASLATLLADRAQTGVRVTLLLEGAPPGGVADQQRWCVERMANAGAHVYYMITDSASGIHDRYLSQHAKLWLIDGRLAVIGSENPSQDSFPIDDKADGTLGRRGALIATDAPSVVRRIAGIIEDDLDPAFPDIWPYDPTHPLLGATPPEFTPVYESGGAGYPAQFRAPLETAGRFRFDVCQAPEHAMRTGDCLLGLLGRVGMGDTLLIEQLQEPPYWGPNDGTVESDPNPRVEAYIAAARRGAKVRILLDAYFDDLKSARSNLRAQEYLAAVARQEGLDLETRRGNPTGLGLHNKMTLAQIDGEGWTMVGSLNGGEASAKVNREVSLLVGSSAVFDYLSAMFWADWGASAQPAASFPGQQVGVE